MISASLNLVAVFELTPGPCETPLLVGDAESPFGEIFRQGKEFEFQISDSK